MAGEASQAELNKFVKVVDEFKAKYALLISPATRTQVYATKNSALISDYETTVSRGNALNLSINALVGAWNAFKSGYAAVTSVTSTVIGDAIDEVRSWFGYKPMGDLPCVGCLQQGLGCVGCPQQPGDREQPGLGALGVIQIPAAVAVAGVITAGVVLIAAMNRIFIALEANKIQRENPSVSRAVAIRQAEAGLPSFLPGGITPIMIGLGALALWMVWSKK